VEPNTIDPTSFSGRIPLFPLPNVVLFPHAFLPLHIFEPRYRAMTKTALEGEGFIGMTLLKPGYESEYYGNPPVHEVVGIGRIVQHEKLSDGRYNMILFGVSRAKIVKVVSQEPYRTVEVELLEDEEEKGKRYQRLRKLLLRFYAEVLRKVLKDAPIQPPEDLPLGPLCDLVSSVLAFDPRVKQELLEDLNVGARCDRLISLLEGAKAPGFGAEGHDRRPAWPPAPSSN
jgi:Lon protease-like protein